MEPLPNRESPVDLWIFGGFVIDVDGFVNVNPGAHLSTLDGIYNIGIAAVDDVGNEADMSLANDLPLDFMAPNPVGNIEIL